MKPMFTRRAFLKTVALAAGGAFLPLRWNPSGVALAGVAAAPLDPATLAKFVDPMPRPGALRPARTTEVAEYEVAMTQFEQRLHRDLPPTRVWGYGGSYPAPSFEVRAGTPVLVRWMNNLPQKHMFGVDTNLHGAIPPAPEVRTVVHLHGGKVPARFDGFSETWLLPDAMDTYLYPNDQRAATLWFHDHAMGITRLNVYAGLAGFYLLRDAA